MRTHETYWAIVRDCDGLELAVASRRKDLTTGYITKDGHADWIGIAGFLPPCETASLVKVTHRIACNWDCDGINEDYAVEYGVCNVCGLPIVD